jgi:hypothetical protein
MKVTLCSVSSEVRLFVSAPLVWRGRTWALALCYSCFCSAPPEPLPTSPAPSLLSSTATPSKSYTITMLSESVSVVLTVLRKAKPSAIERSKPRLYAE